MINKLLHDEMIKQELDYSKLARKCDISPITVKKALIDGNGKLSVYEGVAAVLGKKIKYTLK